LIEIEVMTMTTLMSLLPLIWEARTEPFGTEKARLAG
jgi:hypothetical protein